nr:MAG TPA: Sporulation protein YhaL [Caudoviricetes sp.]
MFDVYYILLLLSFSAYMSVANGEYVVRTVFDV